MSEQLPPEHIANIPAGHKRDEENRKRTDELAEKIAADADNAGSIPSDALKPEPEILQHMNPFTAELEITNARPERHYLWVLSNSTVISSFTAMGYRAVQGDDKECWQHRGQHKAAGSSLRGVGDCLLYWIPKARHELIERHYESKANAMMGVEENLENEWNDSRAGRHLGPLMHGRQDDPLLRRTVLRGSRGQIEKLNDSLKTGKPIEGIQVRG